MAITPLTVTIDLNPSYKKIPAVYVSQLDNNLRSLAITVQDGGVNYDVASSGYDVYVEGTKPDKHGFSYKVTDIGGTVVGSVVTVPMQTQMTCVQGMVPTEIVLKSGADRIGSANFLLVVERAGLAEDVDVSETDIPAYIDGAQQIAAIQQKVEETRQSFVFPEDYGAVGDGTTDDSSAFANALTACRETGKTLYGKSGSVYAIGVQIDMSDVNVDMQNATIKAVSVLAYCIKVDSTKDETVTIENLVLDCNGTSGGIEYITTKHDTITAVSIINCHQTGIVVRAGGGLLAKNMYITGDSAPTTLGIACLTSDCEFRNIIIKDMYRAINNNGTVNYTAVHAWLSGDCTGTVMFQHNGGHVVLTDVQFDTYETAIYRNTDKNLEVFGAIYYINSTLYDSQNSPVIVSFAESASAYSANVHFYGCTFNSRTLTASITNIGYNRILFEHCFFYDNITGRRNDVPMTLTKTSLTDAFTFSHLRQEGKWIKYDGILNKTDALTTGYVAVMQIPSSYMYPDGFTARGSAKLYIGANTPSTIVEVGISVNPNNGIVSLNIPATVTIADVYLIEIHFMYQAKASLDYYRG